MISLNYAFISGERKCIRYLDNEVPCIYTDLILRPIDLGFEEDEMEENGFKKSEDYHQVVII